MILWRASRFRRRTTMTIAPPARETLRDITMMALFVACTLVTFGLALTPTIAALRG